MVLPQSLYFHNFLTGFICWYLYNLGKQFRLGETGRNVVRLVVAMLKKKSVIALLVSVLIQTGLCPGQDIAAFAGQDLHLAAGNMTVYQDKDSQGEHLLVFNGDFSMSIGANQLSSDAAVVWIKCNYLKLITLNQKGSIQSPRVIIKHNIIPMHFFS